MISSDGRFLRPESRPEHFRVAWHSELLELRALGAGQGEEHVALPCRIRDVVEEGSELRARELDCGIGDRLHDPFEVQLSGERRADPVQSLEIGAFRFQRLLGAAPFADVFDDLEQA